MDYIFRIVFYTGRNPSDVILHTPFDSLTVQSFYNLFFPNRMSNDEQINTSIYYINETFNNQNILILPTNWSRSERLTIPVQEETAQRTHTILAHYNWEKEHWGLIGYDKNSHKFFFCESIGGYQITDTKQINRFREIVQKL